MNQIERLRDDLLKRFPDLSAEMDPAHDERGRWFLDIRRPGAGPTIVVEWRSDRGFGVSTPAGDEFGAGPDEVYPNAKAAFDRIVRLILANGRAKAPRAVRLAELRQLEGLSQAELAQKAGVRQSNISRIESRGDVLVSTLFKLVDALDASLSIRVRFADGRERELEIRARSSKESDGLTVADAI